MAKAEKKVDVTKLEDLSFQKRMEMYDRERSEVLAKLQEKYGLGESVQLAYTQHAIVPRIVAIDMLAQKPNEPVKENVSEK